MLYIWVNPLATRWALYLSILPSAFLLSLKTHFHPTIFFLDGHGMVVYVPVCSSEPISQSIASFHLSRSEQDHASYTALGLPSISWIIVAITSSYPTRLAHSHQSVSSSSSYSVRSTYSSLAVPSPA